VPEERKKNDFLVIIDNEFYEFVPEIITVPSDPNQDEVAEEEEATADTDPTTPPAEIIEQSCRSSSNDCICLLYDREASLKKNELRLKCNSAKTTLDTVQVTVQIINTNHISSYPLATKSSVTAYAIDSINHLAFAEG
jgi:hypothetical protein